MEVQILSPRLFEQPLSPRAHRLRWLPNAITVARLIGVPFLLWLLLTAPGPTSVLCGVLFAVLAFTDLVDGHLARVLNARTGFGRIADPLADRLLMAVGLIGLIALGRFSWPGPVIILARDALSMVGFVLLARRGPVMRVDLGGKLSSALNMTVVAVGLIVGAVWVDLLLWVAVVLSVVTFGNYVRRAVTGLHVTDERQVR